MSYERPVYAVETEFRVTGGDRTLAELVSFLVLGRLAVATFSTNRIWSPYIGGGLALVGTNYQTKVGKRERDWFGDEWGYYDDYNSEGDSGMGAYVIGGIEMLRLSRNRLKLELRVDRPLFRLPNQDVMPITLGIFFSSNYIISDFGLF